MGSQIQGSLKGLQWPPSCPAPGGPPTWDIKVSHAEDKPNPTEIPQTLTNWERTQGSSGAEGKGGEPRVHLDLGAELETPFLPQALSAPAVCHRAQSPRPAGGISPHAGPPGVGGKERPHTARPYSQPPRASLTPAPACPGARKTPNSRHGS